MPALFLHDVTGVLVGGAGRGASSRDVAALSDDEDAQKRAFREILERHAPQQWYEVAALRLWLLSGGAFTIHAFIIIMNILS